MTDEAVSPLRRRMIEDMTILIRRTTIIGHAAPQPTITNAVTVLTSNSKRSGLWQVETRCARKGSAQPMRFKDHRKVHARVVERVISATLKSLKPHVARNLKSLIRNTRANRLEVVHRSRVT
jgi:hypothetical protein